MTSSMSMRSSSRAMVPARGCILRSCPIFVGNSASAVKLAGSTIRISTMSSRKKSAQVKTDAPIPEVGPRQPCPCGSGKRYKVCHGKAKRAARAEESFVVRPFEGLPSEVDWVALREIVPSATATVKTTAEYGAKDITIATVLPMAMGGLHRENGEMLLALQTTMNSGDASSDIAAAVELLLESDPGATIPAQSRAGKGPRLQDMLEADVAFEATVHEGFDFWIQEGSEADAEVRASLERANEAIVPTARLKKIEGAYWCRIEREHLRWVLDYEEEALLDAMARVHAKRELHLGPGTKFAGAFRACGLVVPVWDLDPGTEPDEIEDDAVVLADKLAEAVASQEPLNADERRARAGIVSRQLTLR